MAFTNEQLTNARVIIDVGRHLGASTRDIRIALMTAMQESGLRALDYGDRDSLGIFQQRAPWGSKADRMNVAKSATMFFQGGQGGQPGLFDIENRDQLTLGQAAQAVQVSAYPGRYAQWADDAASILKGMSPNDGPGSEFERIGKKFEKHTSNADRALELETERPQFGDEPSPYSPAVGQTSSGGAGIGAYEAPMDRADVDSEISLPAIPKIRKKQKGGGGGFSTDYAGEGWRRRAEKIARRYLGVPYVWGGTTPDGFDCSGFVQYVYKKMGVDLPRISYQQATYGDRIGLNKLRPGDLVAWDNSSRNNGADHIAIYVGNGKIIEAPRPGTSVRISSLYDEDIAWGVRMNL